MLSMTLSTQHLHNTTTTSYLHITPPTMTSNNSNITSGRECSNYNITSTQNESKDIQSLVYVGKERLFDLWYTLYTGTRWIYDRIRPGQVALWLSPSVPTNSA